MEILKTRFTNKTNILKNQVVNESASILFYLFFCCKTCLLYLSNKYNLKGKNFIKKKKNFFQKSLQKFCSAPFWIPVQTFPNYLVFFPKLFPFTWVIVWKWLGGNIPPPYMPLACLFTFQSSDEKLCLYSNLKRSWVVFQNACSRLRRVGFGRNIVE